LLGLEAAYALHKLGMNVTVLERGGSLLRRQLDPRGGFFLREYLQGLGLTITLQAETDAVRGDGRVQEVVLKDGRTLPCDLFLVATGITPNVALARDAGLAVGRGVIVDAEMRTSDPLIFAAGDVVEYHGQVYGLWPVAGEQAQIAAVNALGGHDVYQGSVPVTILKVVGVDLLSVGQIEAESDDEIEIALEQAEEGRYRKLVIAGGHLAGAIVLGYPALGPVVSAAVKRRADVSEHLDALRAGDWDVLKELPDGPRVSTASVSRREPVGVATGSGSGMNRPAGGSASPLAQRHPVRVVLLADFGPVAGERFTVGRGGGTLGREPDNTLPIADSRLSRHHARIAFRDGAFWLEDMESANGTLLNRTRVTEPRRLASGDQLVAGWSRFTVTVEEG
jgi:hypothetical protein